MRVERFEIRKDLKKDKSSEVRDEKRVKNKVEIQISGLVLAYLYLSCVTKQVLVI